MSGNPSQQPTLGGFQTFVQNVMGISPNYLPLDSPSYLYAYNAALNLVNLNLNCLPAQQGSWSLYSQAVYNLAGHNLIEYAPDQSWPISAAAWASNLVTVTTSTPNTLYPGDNIAIAGVSPLAYMKPPPPSRGPFIVNSVVDSEHFTYALSPNPGTANVLAGASVSQTFFQQLRAACKITAFFPGVVGNASDVSTSVGIDNPDFMRGLQLSDLQLLKTPYGQAYLRIAQKAGPTVIGIS
jgi:hypothetical protein